MYDPQMVQPMRDELTAVGFQELKTREEVDALFENKEGTSLVFINSVCGCAAGVARPSLVASLENAILPKTLTTAFAGNDAEATERAREYFVGYVPSSPSMALFRDGQLVHMVERHQIEGQSVESLTKVLTSIYDRYCGETVDESVDLFDPMAELEVTVQEAREQIAADSETAILDVREPFEIEKGKIEGSRKVDQELGNEIVRDWPRERQIIVYCEHGDRSLRATQYLKQQGFENIRSLKGGFAAWSEAN
ncbi:MAG: BrxA/BrxB family bacilliredoxin [Acidobacteriota bacterium]|nr:BrxA/BrxB family bacilliredoxin [Acidobacteriota bacterium]